MKKALLFLAALLCLNSFTATAQWYEYGSDLDMYVINFETYNDTLLAYGFGEPYVYFYNFGVWEPWGEPVPNSNGIHDMAVIDGQLYITPYVNSNPSFLYYRDGDSWSALGGEFRRSGLPGVFTPNLYSLASFNDTIYVCGEFNLVEGNEANYVARWNGNNWEAVGGGIGDAMPPYQVVSPHGMIVAEDRLVLTGNFMYADGNLANGVAAWDGNEWITYGQGFNQSCYGAAVFNDELYVCGEFTEALENGATMSGLAKWNEATGWQNPGMEIYNNGANLYVHTLYAYGNWLYVAGGFDMVMDADDNAYDCGAIARFNGTTVDALYGGVSDYAEAEGIYPLPPGILIGGNFSIAGGEPMQRIAWLYDVETTLVDVPNAVAPNPSNKPHLGLQYATNKTIQITGLLNNLPSNYSLYNLQGQLLEKGILNNATFNLSAYPKGYYFLKVQQGTDRKGTFKVVVR